MDLSCRHPTVNTHRSADPRSDEAALLRLCVDIARSVRVSIPTCRDAQVVRLASQLLRSSSPSASSRLQHAYDAHLCEHACDSASPMTPIEQGWVLGLARFRDQLCRQLNETEPR